MAALQKTNVFVSYAHSNTLAMRKLLQHLKPLERRLKLKFLTDLAINVGDEWDKAISDKIAQSDAMIMMLSAEYFASAYVYEKEFALAQLRHAEKSVLVLPVLYKRCDWENVDFIRGIQIAPRSQQGQLRAIQNWSPTNDGYAQAAKEIGLAIVAYKAQTLAA